MNIHPLWYLCLLTRVTFIFILVFISTHFRDKLWIRILVTAILTIMGSGFLYKYFTGSNNEKQITKVFWHESRLLHGILYLIAAYYFFIENIVMMTVVLSIDIVSSLFYRFITYQ